jgi:Tol biopolymer transport system component
VPWIAGAALVAAGAAGWWLVSGRAPESPVGPLKITPFTTDGGVKSWPRLSPDGAMVAYDWRSPEDDSFQVYVKAVSPGARPLRLTDGPGRRGHPVWSPDGRRLAFLGRMGDGAAIFIVPWPGGQERKLIELSGPAVVHGADLVPALSWSPDGAWLAFGETTSEEEPARIVRVSLDTGEKQPLTSPPEKTQGDFYPAFSPDGRLLAFARTAVGSYGGWDVWVQGTNGQGEARRVTFASFGRLAALEWTPDGSEILVTKFGAEFTIHRVPLAGGDPVPILGVGAGFPSVRGTRMVYLRQTWPPWDVWRAPGRRGPPGEARRLIASTRTDSGAVYSPEGDRIVFGSDRSGSGDIWVSDSEGSDPVQLTFGGGGSPRWSPDGRQILFDSLEEGNWNIYVVDAEGGTPRRLTPADSDENVGSWSRDGRFIYFQSSRSGDWQIWKIPTGGGEAVQVTRGGGTTSQESWDGRHLFYARSETSTAIWKVPVECGEETEVFPGPVRNNKDWAVTRDGLYYATQRRDQHYSIHFLEFGSGQVTEILRRETRRTRYSMSVSPDEKWILFAEAPGPVTSELMLAESFR